MSTLTEGRRESVNIVGAILAASFAAPALAQPSISWYSIDGGGGLSSGAVSGGTITIHGTIGQADAGACSDVSGPGILGGFWAAGDEPSGCPADLDDGSGAGTHDGAVTIDDLLFFLARFESGSLGADLDNDGDPTTGNPDGAVTIDDLLFFLARFEAGC